MRILVFGHWLEIGGTQVNAIELAAALRDVYAHDVTYFATPGPMLDLVRARRLRFLPAPPARVHPSPARMAELWRVLRRERFDLIHAWDWWQCLDAYYVAHLAMRLPLAVTDMSMVVHRVLPRSLPTTFGTPELVDQARAKGHRRAELILPPVDVRENAPGVVDPGPFRRQHGIGDSEVLLVSVSRLAAGGGLPCAPVKVEGLRRTIDVVRTLGKDFPLRLVIVGDGVEKATLEALAARANEELGRRAVVLPGALLDPRPAYAAADVVVGMGGSALRAMAFAKPVLVVGERGFSGVFAPETAESFHYRGFYGIGDGSPGNERLAADVRALAGDPERLRALGGFSRRFVAEHHSLEAVGARLEAFLRAAAGVAPRLSATAADGLRSAAVWLRERRYRW